MKFPTVFYSLALSGSVILAQESNNSDVSDDANRNLNNVKDIIGDATSGYLAYFEEIASQQGVSKKRATKDFFLHYGCYCFAYDNHSAGPRNNYHGPPKDELDNLCYKLWRAQTCLKADLLESGAGECDTRTEYKIHRDDNTKELKCGRHPKQDGGSYINDPANACAMQLCALEMSFVQSVVDLLKTDFERTNEYKFTHKSGKYETECPAGKGSGSNNNNGNNKQCCGEGFDRRPYNDVMHSCCVDGSVTSFGSCP